MKFNLSYLPVINFSKKAPTCQDLLTEFQKYGADLRGEKLKFDLDGDIDVYNITAPFQVGDKTYIAGRLEKHQEFLKSLVTFFTPGKDGVWRVDLKAPRFNLEDPCVTKIGEQIVLGGVKILDPKSTPVKFVMVFYKGKNLQSLRQFAVGPNQMKDIRLVDLKNGKIGVFTRPQGELGGKGTIGFTVINSLKEFTPANLLKAKLFKNQFAPNQWGGANEIHLLDNGELGVLSHYAFDFIDEKGQYQRNYFATVFKYNPQTDKRSPLKIIATRSNFPDGKAKTNDLHNVIFSGGLIRRGGGQAVFYGGLSDAEAGQLTIPDPFA